MIGAGLSLDQAPPFEATSRFFLSVPLFIIFAGVLLIFKEMVLIRTDSSVIALVHLFTLGVFSMVMFGAIGQMLPVLAGVSIPKALLIARWSHLLLLVGTSIFIYGFLTQVTPFLALIASICLGLSFVLVLGSALYSLKHTQKFSSTVKAITVAIIAGLITSFLGIWLLNDYASAYSEVHESIMSLHMVWGIFGFAGILIIGVAFKIIPMFYVAPGFKKFCKKWVVPLIVLGIVVWTFLSMFSAKLAWIGLLIIATFFLAFSVTVIKKLNQRRRPISDVTVCYWRFAGGNLFVGMIVSSVNAFISLNLDIYIAVFIGGGFILSILTGMLYKIVPFLVWFHLNAKGHFEIPTMREMINAKLAKVQFGFHLLSLILLIEASYYSSTLRFAGFAFVLSGGLLMFNLLKAVKIYLKHKDLDPMAVFEPKEA